MVNKLYNDFKIGDIVRVKGWLGREDKNEFRSRKLRWVDEPVVRVEGESFLYAYYVGWTVKYNGRVDYEHELGSTFISDGGAVIAARLKRHSRAKDEFAFFTSIEKVEGIDPDVEWRKSFHWPDTEFNKNLKQDLREDAQRCKCPKCGKFLVAKSIYKGGPEYETRSKVRFERHCKSCGFKDTKGFNKGKMVK